jgi:hypothetical protein
MGVEEVEIGGGGEVAQVEQTTAGVRVDQVVRPVLPIALHYIITRPEG